MALRKVLLVGWDAADWKVIYPLMNAGKMPNLQRLVEHGASGQISGAASHESFAKIESAVEHSQSERSA
jgi:predicted AlkP superfamily phosphohydrolase/phosphomutase